MGELTGDVNRRIGLLDLCASWARANGTSLHGMSAGNVDAGGAEYGDRLGRHVCWKGVIEG